MTIKLRAATPADGPAMAELANIAGEGMPATLWATQSTGAQQPLEVGSAKAARGEGIFSWKNAVIAEVDGATAGMMVSYLTSETPETFDENTHPIVRPLVALTGKAPGTRYINALATFEAFRRKGVARALLAEAETKPGRNGVSIITTDCNRGAQAFYASLGYRPEFALPVIKADWDTDSSEWVLMRKPRD